MDQARKQSILNVAEERIELRKFAPEFATLPTQVEAAPGRKERTMKMDDLRDFLELLEEFGEVQRVKVQVDWNLEWGQLRDDAAMILARPPRCSRILRDILRAY